ncbi:hypothetical protein [Rhizobium sp.]|uniref:hypothetical protein n=1 Tax=Rhizobium sp. TaxID=391 RepID=UPI0034C6979C
MKNPVRVGALIASVILFGLFVYLIVVGADKGQYITVAVVFAFAVIATRLDDITNLTFGATGLQAALEKKLKEAQATITQLQGIAELFGQISVQQITLSNRWDGLSSREKREAIERIERELRAIGLTDDRIENILSTQRAYDRFDYYLWVAQVLPAPGPTVKEFAAFTGFQAAFPNASPGAVPTIADVEAYLRTHDIYNGEWLERLNDWKQYERDHTHRRVELWDHRHG